jgi:hypothetical protein
MCRYRGASTGEANVRHADIKSAHGFIEGNTAGGTYHRLAHVPRPRPTSFTADLSFDDLVPG